MILLWKSGRGFPCGEAGYNLVDPAKWKLFLLFPLHLSLLLCGACNGSHAGRHYKRRYFMNATIETPQSSPVTSSFSLSFAVPSRVNGEDLLATAPGSDGTIGGNTPYQTGGDGQGPVENDDQEDDDER
jgi:hypothetical protein